MTKGIPPYPLIRHSGPRAGIHPFPRPPSTPSLLTLRLLKGRGDSTFAYIPPPWIPASAGKTEDTTRPPTRHSGPRAGIHPFLRPPRTPSPLTLRLSKGRADSTFAYIPPPPGFLPPQERRKKQPVPLPVIPAPEPESIPSPRSYFDRLSTSGPSGGRGSPARSL